MYFCKKAWFNHVMADQEKRVSDLNADTVYSLVAVSRRLRQVREALGLSQSQLCRMTGINPQVWNNAETGDNMISVINAIRLYEKTGVHLHWVFYGMADVSLPQTLREALIHKYPSPRTKQVEVTRPRRRQRR
jgi:transcriptional regulator with XRE-family HTH domain